MRNKLIPRNVCHLQNNTFLSIKLETREIFWLSPVSPKNWQRCYREHRQQPRAIATAIRVLHRELRTCKVWRAVFYSAWQVAKNATPYTVPN